MKYYLLICLYQRNNASIVGEFGCKYTFGAFESEEYALAEAVRYFRDQLPPREGYFDLQPKVHQIKSTTFNNVKVTIDVQEL